MGEVLAWIIGWDLILEYGVSVAAVAVGWGAYFVELLDSVFGVTLSDSISLPPGEGGEVNVPALVLVLAVAALLISGIRQSARSNTAMVITKVLMLIFFIVVAFSAFDGDHFSDFAPNGFGGIETAAALIFFAYGYRNSKLRRDGGGDGGSGRFDRGPQGTPAPTSTP
jgi:APA family basic amino acid/polyamine antiporter